MSRRSSRSSSGPSEFDVCAMSASSTPNKDSTAPRPGSTRHSLSLGGPSSPTSPGGGPAPGPATPGSTRNAQFPKQQQQRRRSSGSGSSRQSGQRLLGLSDMSRRLFDSPSSEHFDDLNLAEAPRTRESVARLLREEAEDVRLAAMLSGSVAGANGFGVGPPPRRFPLSEPLRHAQKDMRAVPVGDSMLFQGEGEEPGNLSPGEVAAMMHRLEHGVSMAAPPDQLFKFLFPNASKSKQVGKKRSEEAEDESGAPRGNANTLHEGESCPLVCFAGGFPGTDCSKAHTLVQLRGDAPPPWFPGYFVALPQTGGVLRTEPSPTNVMQAAYMAARPGNIPPECRFVY